MTWQSNQAAYFWTTSVSTRAANVRSGLAASIASLTDDLDSVPNPGAELLIELKPFEIPLGAPLLHQLKEFNGSAAVSIVLRVNVHVPLIVVVTRGA